MKEEKTPYIDLEANVFLGQDLEVGTTPMNWEYLMTSSPRRGVSPLLFEGGQPTPPSSGSALLTPTPPESGPMTIPSTSMHVSQLVQVEVHRAT